MKHSPSLGFNNLLYSLKKLSSFYRRQKVSQLYSYDPADHPHPETNQSSSRIAIFFIYDSF